MAAAVSEAITWIQYAWKLIDYAMQVYDAPDDIKLLRDQIEASEAAVKQVKDYWEKLPPARKAEPGLKNYESLIEQNMKRYGDILHDLASYIESKVKDDGQLQGAAKIKEKLKRSIHSGSHYAIWPLLKDRFRMNPFLKMFSWPINIPRFCLNAM